MIKGYVKGARNVKGFFALESTPSLMIVVAGLRAAVRGGFPGWLPGSLHPTKVDPLDPFEESTWAQRRSAKSLITSQNSELASRGGFQVDSPVRNPVASEIAR
jgi:hypothetical protein